MNEEKKVKSKQKYPLIPYVLGMLALVLVLLLLSYLAQNRTTNKSVDNGESLCELLVTDTENIN